MQIIPESSFDGYCRRFPNAANALKAWRDNLKGKNWKTPSELKAMFRSASILKGGRVVFNIAGNKYRLITTVHYRKSKISLIWFGTHKNYDKIDAQEISYVAD